MAQIKISELDTLSQQLQSADYVPMIHSGVTYKFAPFNYLVKNSGDETITGVKTFSSTPIMTLQGGSASSVIDIVQLRKDTAANWTSINPVLHQGEQGLETDTGKIKTGDGATAWNSLSSAVYQTLSDTFTPTLLIGGVDTGIVYVLQDGCYQKVGNKIDFSIYIEISSKGSLVGNVSIGAFPFNAGTKFSVITIGYYKGMPATGVLSLYKNINDNTANFTILNNDGTLLPLRGDQIQNSMWFMATGTYYI